MLEPVGVSKTTRVLLTLLEDREAVTEMTRAEAELAEARFAAHFGAVNSGDARSADNERIDMELARESGNSHESD